MKKLLFVKLSNNSLYCIPTRNGIVRGWGFPGECDADKYLTWNNEELHHNEIDNFYRGSLLCKPNESVQFNFTNDMSVIEIKL